MAISASLFIAAQLARPILTLTDFTRRFARGQALLPPLPGGPGEVGELTTSFFQMIQDLERSREDLIRAAKLAVVGEMAAAMAHEVRTPLGILRTSAQMLQREPQLSTEGQEMAGFVVSETDRLNRLISTLLDLARPRPPVFHEEDVHRIIRRATELLSQRAARQRIRIEEQFQTESAIILCDGEQLLQVFLNLFLNALQILLPNGTITVRTELVQEHLKIEVADNGPGIALQHRERIFDPFFTTRADGVGLGLTIVQQIVHTHRGEISVHDNPGGGACFHLRFPRSRSTNIDG
jgi:signal transduction histidine kinase